MAGFGTVKFDRKKWDNEITRHLNDGMLNLGKLIVNIARRYTPVKTGTLQRSERFDYNFATYTLTFISDVGYDIFVEFGTRYMQPRPHWRPAINTVGPIYGYNIEMSYANIPEIQAPILAAGPGFHLPSTLTAKQREHVRQHLLPTSKRHFISNVRRARMNIRRYF